MKIVIINCFETYEHRVDLLHEFFISRGDEVNIITSNFMHFNKTYRNDTKKDFIYIPVASYYKNLSFARLISHYKFAKHSLKKAYDFSPQLIWILVPPNSLAKFGSKYKKHHPEVNLIYDFIDMWPETLPISKIKNLPPFNFWKNLRNKNIYNSDLIVTECNLFHSLLKKFYDINKIFTLYLAHHIKTYVSELNLPSDKIGLCYLGSINNIIDIPLIGEIIKSFDMPVKFHIIGDGENKDNLIKTAIDSGAETVFHGQIYDFSEKQKIFDQCHFGLNIMKDSVYVGLTMKSIDYFEAGLPIINNIKGDTWDLIEEHNIGINYPDNLLNNKINGQAIKEKRNEVRLFFEENFSAEAFNCKIELILKNLKTN